MTALAAVAAYLPEHRVRVADLAERLELSQAKVRVFQRFHGLEEVCRDPEGSLYDLIAAAAGALEELRGRERQVRYVIYARGMPAAVPYPLNPLHELCRALGLQHAVAFTVTQQACASGLLAVDIAGRLLASDGDPDALALVLAGEKTFTIDAELVPDTSIFGEGASACLVAADGPRDRMLAYAARVRGDFDGRLAVSPEVAQRFAKEYSELMAEVVLAAVDQAGLRLEEIGVILPHNVNAVSWRQVCRRIGYPLQRVVLDNVPRTGHCFAADPFISYRTAVERGLLRPGEPYLMAAAGLGAIFSAMVLRH